MVEITPCKWDRGYRFVVCFQNTIDKDFKTKTAAVKRAADWMREYPDDNIRVIDRKDNSVVFGKEAAQ